MGLSTNDVLRRLRFALTLDDVGVAALCAQGGVEVTSRQVRSYTAKEEQDDYVEGPDDVLQAFLAGLILDRRGPPPAGKPVPPPAALSTNGVFRSLRIALVLRDQDILRMLAAGGHTLSKSELSAFFRRPDHKHYRECGHQVLRKFLRGLTMELRPNEVD